LAIAASSLPVTAGFSLPKLTGLDLGIGHTQQTERTAHGLGALLAQGQVVFAATALVGVPLDRRAAGFGSAFR
jgi:hypothetical protein